jgi:hypothetical protein
MCVSWESAVLERCVRVVSSLGGEGGAGRRWIVSGRARKRACRRDQSVSCHCDVIYDWDGKDEKGGSEYCTILCNVHVTYHDGFIARPVLLFLTGGNANRDSIGPICLHERGDDE